MDARSKETAAGGDVEKDVVAHESRP
jgi:hypothetical protein